ATRWYTSSAIARRFSRPREPPHAKSTIEDEARERSRDGCTSHRRRDGRDQEDAAGRPLDEQSRARAALGALPSARDHDDRRLRVRARRRDDGSAGRDEYGDL